MKNELNCDVGLAWPGRLAGLVWFSELGLRVGCCCQLTVVDTIFLELAWPTLYTLFSFSISNLKVSFPTW